MEIKLRIDCLLIGEFVLMDSLVEEPARNERIATLNIQ